MVGFRGKDKDDGNEQQFVFQVSLCSSFFEKKKMISRLVGSFSLNPGSRKPRFHQKKTAENPMEYILYTLGFQPPLKQWVLI